MDGTARSAGARLKGRAMKPVTSEQIQSKRDEVEQLQRKFLEQRGWKRKCDFPGSVWLFTRKLEDGRTICVDESTAIFIEDAHDSYDCGPMPTRPAIVCLCGSTKFIEQMAIKAWEFEKAGAIALSCHLLPDSYGAAGHHQAEAEGVADAMDALHLHKIDIADKIFVINVGGYIGDSTRREIEYATKHGKLVEYLEPNPIAAG